jgi:hypothetical protein
MVSGLHRRERFWADYIATWYFPRWTLFFFNVTSNNNLPGPPGVGKTYTVGTSTVNLTVGNIS